MHLDFNELDNKNNWSGALRRSFSTWCPARPLQRWELTS